MDNNRIEELRGDFNEMLNEVLDSVQTIEDITLKDIGEERLKEFESARLYEFLPYREEIGGRIIFECIKEGEKTFFNEKYRIYRKGDIYGIEERDNPSYLEGVGRTIYSRIPEQCTLLDLGCGTAKYLKAVNSPERTVLALDISEDIIEDNKKAPGLENIHFLAGDLNNLNPLQTGELDFITGINLINVLSIEKTTILLTQTRRVAARGLLFGFTLPTQADLWTDLPTEELGSVIAGMNDPDATPDERELASEKSFEGQMNLFMFIKAVCRQKDWKVRIFRFLDRFTLNEDDFLKTDDSSYIGFGNNTLVKFLEYPVRKAAKIDGVPAKNYLVNAVGYGMEVFFSPETVLPPAEGVYYFDDDFDFTALTVQGEMNNSVDFWKLPFEKFSD